MPLHIQVVTPEKIILDTMVNEAIIPTIAGEITILPQHIPLFTQLSPGELILHSGDTDQNLVVMGGFVEVEKDHITILADYAVNGKDLSAVKAQEAVDRAEKAMKEKANEKDFIIAEAEFRKAILELRVAEKIQRKHSN